MQQDDITPEPLNHDRKAPQRSCIVTREAQDKDQLIRFVGAPDGTLMPDLAGKLPGRGYWVSAKKSVLSQAISEKRFMKVARKPLQVPDDLSQQVEKQLYNRALQFIALANKAGALVMGFEKVAESLKKGGVIALIHAEEASADSMKKLAISDDKRYCCFPAQALSSKLGAEHAVHMALLNAQAGHAALKEIQRFTGFLQS